MRIKVPIERVQIEDILKILITSVKINPCKWEKDNDESFAHIQQDISDAQN